MAYFPKPLIYQKSALGGPRPETTTFLYGFSTVSLRPGQPEKSMIFIRHLYDIAFSIKISDVFKTQEKKNADILDPPMLE